MGSLVVRNVDDKLIARLKQRAAEHGRSTEAEHRLLLQRALDGIDIDQLAARLREITAGRHHTPAEELLREMRDER